mmetsp:Transcript_13048/g.28274  ORF Transcript_13048/g.28274 Transcript_13048/m.28274 type:complete len:394 (-) Transcript_13048:2140-3321(-)|eukprot:CAMPEP_0178505416 /NCGR_PEP_ID=MMETSP0696-20121128/19118_1 /TAXON_ID=265572 /ORGANISM="Extubocellulus spinifer, Strain CCMP396" /LENGTH=393 /DNA_ID=CAMNT_0020134723 /DNA_START=167 /DNA_END=1348 /DNA_ORIENTATION=-
MPDCTVIFSRHSAFEPLATKKKTLVVEEASVRVTPPLKQRANTDDTEPLQSSSSSNSSSSLDQQVEQRQSTADETLLSCIDPAPKLHKRAASDPCANRLPTSYRHEALEDLLATLCERHERFGEAHPKTGSTYNQLGTYHFRHGNYCEAETAYAEALHCYQMAFKTGKHRNKEYCRTKGARTIASILNNIGTVKWRTGHLAEAAEYLDQVLAIQEGLLARQSDKLLIDPIEVGGTWYNVGIVHSLSERYSKSLRALYRARQLYQEAEAMYGPLLLETSRVIDAIGKIYILSGKPDKALHHLEDAIRMKKRILDNKHPSVLRSLSSMADAYKMKSDHAMAAHLYHKILHAQGVAFDRAPSKDESDIIALDISATKKALSELKNGQQGIPNEVCV